MATASRVGGQLLPIDWGAITPLRLRARLVAEGVYAGMHRSRRRGPGVEFGGQRAYVPGDDLRLLDRRSLLKHGRLMVRQFETDTERALWLCLDASASMAFRSAQAPGSKLAYAALLAAALTRVTVAAQDAVGLSWLGGDRLMGAPATFGAPAFDRVVSRLEAASAAGDLVDDEETLSRCVRLLDHSARRGSVVVVLSDLLDLPASAVSLFASLSAGRRIVVLVQVLDPCERDLNFSGKVRLQSVEGDVQVYTDADAVRQQYKEALEGLVAGYRRQVEGAGGRLVQAVSSDDPVQVVRQVLRAIAEAHR